MTALPLSLALLASLTAQVAPDAPRQTLEVIADAAQVTPLTWASSCGEPPQMVRLPRGTRMDLVETGEDWQIRIGEEPVFGTNVCGGMNPTLKPTKQRREGNEWFVACTSQRVVQGTEKTETYLTRKPDGRVEVKAKLERFVIKDAESCKVLLERQTLLGPEAAVDVEPSGEGGAPGPLPPGSDGLDDAALGPNAAGPGGAGPGAAGPGSPPAGVGAAGDAAQLSVGERAQIESEISRAVKAVQRETDMAPLRIVHENRMSDDIRVVERSYILDGKPIGEEEGTRWGGLKAGALSQVYDDVAQVGVHVLEVEFVYAVDGAKLRVKDAVFFDVVAEEPTRIRLEAYETGSFFTPIAQKPKLRFEVNGKPYQG